MEMDPQLIKENREKAENQSILDILKQQKGSCGSYEIAEAIGLPTHAVYPRLLNLVEKEVIQSSGPDAFQVPRTLT